MTQNKTGMERLPLQLFLQASREIQNYHINKALTKIRRRQITLAHVLVSKYQQLVQQNGLQDVFNMNTHIRTITYAVFEGIRFVQHPYQQQPMNPIKLREVLMDCVDCIEKLMNYEKNETMLNLMFHFTQQIGHQQKRFREAYSISWIPILP